MREEILLDALVDYQIEPEDPTRTTQSRAPRVDKEIQAALADFARLEREYGAGAATNAEQSAALRLLMASSANTCAPCAIAWRSRARSVQDLPKSVEVRDLNERAVVKLAMQRST
jgi:hypothetical protein